MILFAGTCLLFLSHCRPQAITPGYKVVSLSPAMTEVIFALNAQEKLVGVTTYCTYPEQAQSITKIGDFSNPSLERIIGLKPDLVIVNTPEQQRLKRQLEQLNITIFESSPQSLQDIYDEIRAIGAKLNATHTAESIVTYMKESIIPSGTIKKRVYVELSPRPLITIGSTTFLDELLDMAGGENIFSDHAKPYPVVTQEAVIERDPQIIILLHPEPFGTRVGWNNVSAVKNGTIFTELNQDHLMRPGPRLVEGFRALTNALHD
jgi:iron complex transport system substrate-binding protein